MRILFGLIRDVILIPRAFSIKPKIRNGSIRHMEIIGMDGDCGWAGKAPEKSGPRPWLKKREGAA